MTSYFKRHPYRIIRPIRSIGSIAMNATYFYVAQFLALVITLSAIGGTNGALFGQQIDISVLKSVNVIFLVFVTCVIVGYIMLLVWNSLGGRSKIAFPTGPVLGIGLVHLLRYAGVYTIYSTGKAAAYTGLGLILVYLISRAVASFLENKALAGAEKATVEIAGSTLTVYAFPESREFTVTRSVEPTGYTMELHPDSPVARAVEEAKAEIDRREAAIAELVANEHAEEPTPTPVLDKEAAEEHVEAPVEEQVPAAPSVAELRDAYARVINQKQDKPAKRLGAAAKRKNLEPSGRKLTAHERKLQSRIRSGRRHK